MGKATKTNRKKYEIKLNIPDQRHMSYLSDGHAISCSSRLAQNQPFQSFENYLLDAVFARANQDIGQYAAYMKKQQEAAEKAKLQQIEDEAMDKEYEVDDSAIDNEVKNASDTNTDDELGEDIDTELNSEIADTGGQEEGA